MRTEGDYEKHRVLVHSVFSVNVSSPCLLFPPTLSFPSGWRLWPPDLRLGGRRGLFTSCVALDKSLDLSESQLPSLKNGKKNTYLKESFQGLHDMQDGKLPGT